jgi:beta-xylosidase
MRRLGGALVLLSVSAIGVAQSSANTTAKATAVGAAVAYEDRPTTGEWGAQPGGTYANPVLPADFSDLDATAVGDTYYAITSTMQYSPGMTVLQSKDLVNWKILGGVVPDLTVLDSQLNWDRMSRAGHGIWAGAIRFHDGRFWVYFATPDQGIFMSTAKDAAGPWTTVYPVMKAPGWDDTCPFWDDDGQMYLVTSHTGPEGPEQTKYNIHLFKLTPEGHEIVPGYDRVIHQSRGSEANKLYKWGGLYYHYYSEVRSEGRVAMMERAKSLDGPWETRQLLHVHGVVDKDPNQGGIVQTPSGKWYFFTHQGRGDWEGRAAVLLPVTWVDDAGKVVAGPLAGPAWPIPGGPGPDGIGNMVWRGAMPVGGKALSSVVTGDDFSASTLKPEWQWNYQPRPGMWSLTERPGFLRLHAFAPLKPNDLKTVGDVLTQRAFRSKRNEVTVKLDLTGMVDGQEAGLAHFAKTSASLSVVQYGATPGLTVTVNGARPVMPLVPMLDDLLPGRQKTIWLRSTWGFDGLSQFSYSFDGKAFTPIGDPYQLTWGSYRGDRVGLFTTNAKDQGWVDFAAFQYEVER